MLWESIVIALRGLAVNKLRTALTMLGIIIGVGAVIALISIGNGFRDQINSSFSSLGTNVMWVNAGNSRIFRGEGGGGRDISVRQVPDPLTLTDAEAIADPLRVSGVVDVAPEYNVSTGRSVVRGQTELSVSITGVSSAHETVRNYVPEVGRFINEDDIEKRSRVAVLGSRVAEELFESYEYPLGEKIRLNGVSFEIVGVLEEKGQTGFGGGSDDAVLIPITTAQTRLGQAGSFRGSLIVSTIYIQTVSQESMESVSEQITALMRERHNLAEADDDDFAVTTQAELLEFGSTITTGLTAFLGSIAGVSLLVGGIGIMNIMLVSVTERTREIGIRKSVGAKRRDIMLQFLVESIVLSLIGGFIGVGLGYGLSKLMPNIVPNLDSAVVTPGSILLATGFSLMIGLFFGVYPATRAARLKPIDALRYE